MPALARVIFHNEHMIGKDVTETELCFVNGLCLRCFSFLNFDFHCKNIPS